MSEIDTQGSEVQKFYVGKVVFITGASGFLGKLLVEKLLRSCPDLKHIYILLREKKNKLPEERFKELFDIPAFEKLRSQQPNFEKKISILEGDLNLPYLGLSEISKAKIIENVNCIFHLAATVRFDEHVKKATYINVRSTRDLLCLAREIRNLQAFVHVSTAFSNCDKVDIEEKFYKPVIPGNNLLNLVECLDDNILDDFTPRLLQDIPNTYVLTKAIAEEVVKTEGVDLPVAIVRPSIVISTKNEPVPGWLDNIYGPTSILMGAALGLLRSLCCKSENVADLVPADFVINNIIVVAWDVAQYNDQMKGGESKTSDQNNPKIYNYVSGPQNPITWGKYKDLAREYGLKIPSPHIIWHSIFIFCNNYYLHWIVSFLLQTVPAHVIDFLAKFIGKKPSLVAVYKKIDKFCDAISYFTMRQWNFKNENVQNLWMKMNKHDRKLYNFDITSYKWPEFFSSYLLGARLYLLKDPLTTIPQGRRKIFIVKIAHYTFITIFCLLLYKLFALVWKLF